MSSETITLDDFKHEYTELLKYNFDKKQFIANINLLEQISALHKQIYYYQMLIANPNNAILNFTTNENHWNAVMQFPYWLKISKDKERCSNETIYLLMIKPGIKTINFDNLKKFNNDNDPKRRYIVDDNYFCDRLIITVPKSLNFDEIKKLVIYGFTHAMQINFICEDTATSIMVKTLSLEKYFSFLSFDSLNGLDSQGYLYPNNSFDYFDFNRYCANDTLSGKIRYLNFYDTAIEHGLMPIRNVIVNVDPDYYRNYFLNTPSNKTYWHQYDYSSIYKFHRKDVITFNGKIDCALKASRIHNIIPTLDMVLELVLGSYSNFDKFPDIRLTYNELINNLEDDIKKEFAICRRRIIN